jgi:hypothetical protein
MKIVKQFEDVVKFEVEVVDSKSVKVVANVQRHSFDNTVEYTRIELARIELPKSCISLDFTVHSNSEYAALATD